MKFRLTSHRYSKERTTEEKGTTCCNHWYQESLLSHDSTDSGDALPFHLGNLGQSSVWLSRLRELPGDRIIEFWKRAGWETCQVIINVTSVSCFPFSSSCSSLMRSHPPSHRITVGIREANVCKCCSPESKATVYTAAYGVAVTAVPLLLLSLAWGRQHSFTSRQHSWETGGHGCCSQWNSGFPWSKHLLYHPEWHLYFPVQNEARMWLYLSRAENALWQRLPLSCPLALYSTSEFDQYYLL